MKNIQLIIPKYKQTKMKVSKNTKYIEKESIILLVCFLLRDHVICRLIPKIEFDFGLYHDENIAQILRGYLSILHHLRFFFLLRLIRTGHKKAILKANGATFIEEREWENIELCPSNPVKVGHCTYYVLWPRVRRALNISQGKWAIDPQSQKNSNGFPN